MMDLSNGYESISAEWPSRRGSIGLREVREWAKSLPQGRRVRALGGGPGLPLTIALVEEGLQVFGIDAAPSFVAAFRRNLPGTPVVCESVLESNFFDRRFDAVLSIGLMFLLKTEQQHRLIRKR